MGHDQIRYLRTKGGRFYWQPDDGLQDIGMTAEALGKDYAQARARAVELNNWADELRRQAGTGENGPVPGSVTRLFIAYKDSDEFKDLKPRTQKDYRYYLSKIEADFGRLQVRSLTPRVLKEYYKRVKSEVTVTWAYHIFIALRAVLSWAVADDWITHNPALDITVKMPPKRRVVWAPEQADAYVAKAKELKWYSLAAMVRVFDSIGQSPIDVRTLPARAYDGTSIETGARAKTGATGARIRLFPDAKAELDAYLKGRVTGLMFLNDKTQRPWVESTLHKTHNIIRKAACIPHVLQLQDFRRTAQTEGGAAGGTVDELRGLARHSTRTAALHYVIPDDRYVDSIQEKRLARRGRSQKMGNSETATEATATAPALPSGEHGRSTSSSEMGPNDRRGSGKAGLAS